ncbi:MAG: (2Fe-2S)-binding protein [Candidatus Marinimicrobia bacterium]|nr:(2Fe-2S)-binding protein [Candidatus Neomarinimicrobiota bacterium]
MLHIENPEYYTITLTVNGKELEKSVPSHMRLLDLLRNELHFTGAKEVCSEGECGACTIFMDSKTVNSCLILAVEADKSEIITIEGFPKENSLTELQQEFIDHHSVQCGYCIPGMVLSGEQILKDHENPDRMEIKKELSGNICRCTGYHKIVDAIEHAGHK